VQRTSYEAPHAVSSSLPPLPASVFPFHQDLFHTHCSTENGCTLRKVSVELDQAGWCNGEALGFSAVRSQFSGYRTSYGFAVWRTPG